MNTTPLVTFHNVEPARELRERLRTAGIPAVIHDETRLQRFWYMSAPMAAIHLEVPQSQYLEALRLVQDWDRTTRCLSEAVRCPECFSSRVEFPQMTRKFISPGVLLTVLSLLGVVQRRFYCSDCHYTWPVAERLDTHRDIPGWPLDSKMWETKRARHH